jgi:hypothetical protein
MRRRIHVSDASPTHPHKRREHGCVSECPVRLAVYMDMRRRMPCHMRRRIHVSDCPVRLAVYMDMRRRIHAMSYEEEDTCH